MSVIKHNIATIRSTIPYGVELVCVSKFHSADAIQQAYDAGERCFGESRAQELVQKVSALPSDIEWHFIGHLQRNKVKMVVPYVSLIHSIDSLELLREVERCAAAHNRIVRVLLQVHIAQEKQKFGFSANELRRLMETCSEADYAHVQVCGLMGMATFTDSEEQISAEFKTLRALFDELKAGVCARNEHFNILSMGMSDDYPLAIACGSTMVRVGSAIFGSRG